MSDESLSRQVRLREVGIRGQELLARAHVSLMPDQASSVAKEYLQRSGVGCVELNSAAIPVKFAHAQHFTNEVCMSFAQGAWVATRKIADLLGIDPTGVE